MKYADLILDSPVSKNIPLYEELLAEALLLEANIKDLYAKFYANDLTFQEFQTVVNLDPTTIQGDNNRFTDEYQKIGDYVKWMIVQLRKSKSNIFFEDIYKYKKCLKAFDKEKKTNRLPPDKRDINRFKSLNDLYDFVEPFIEKSPEERDAEEIEKTQVKTVYSDAEWDIKVPLTYAASCLLGKNTRWCTATPDYPNQYNNYTAEGPLYILIHKSTGVRYQFHFESSQFMDVNDRGIDPIKFLEERPAILKFFESIGKVTILKPIEEIKFNDASVVTCKFAKQSGFILFNLDGKLINFHLNKNITEDVKLLVITGNSCSLWHIPTVRLLCVGRKNHLRVVDINILKKTHPDVFNYIVETLPEAHPIKIVPFKKCVLSYFKIPEHMIQYGQQANNYKLVLNNESIIVDFNEIANVVKLFVAVTQNDKDGCILGHVEEGITFNAEIDMNVQADLFDYLVKKYYKLYDGIKKRNGQYYLIVNDWSDLLEQTPVNGGTNVKKYLANMLSGVDVDSSDYTAEYDTYMYDNLSDKNKALIQQYIVENNLTEIFEGEKIDDAIGNYDELEDVKHALQWTLSDLQQSADLNEAEENIIKQLGEFWGSCKFVKSKDKKSSKLVVHLQRSMIFAALSTGENDFNYGLSEAGFEFEYHEPRYGYNGTVDDESYNESVTDRLMDLLKADVKPQKEQMVLPASNSIFTEIQNSLIKGSSGKYIEEND